MEMDRETIKEIINIGGNPYFVRFLLAYHGLIHSEVAPFTITKWPEAQRKRTNRAIKKHFGNSAKSMQAYTTRRIKKDYLNSKILKTPFYCTPLPSNPSYRPRKDAQWVAVYHLRNYFIKFTRRPNMSLIYKIIFPDKNYFYINSEWSKRRQRIETIMSRPIFTETINGVSITKAISMTDNGILVTMTTNELLKYYEVNEEKIKEALDTDARLIDIIRNKAINRKDKRKLND